MEDRATDDVAEKGGEHADDSRFHRSHPHVRLVTEAETSKENKNEQTSEEPTSSDLSSAAAAAASDVERGSNATKRPSFLRRYFAQTFSSPLPPSLAWILPVLKDWSKIKPILRSSLAAWICMILMIIEPVERTLGTASFLILVGIFIQPAEIPLAGVIEREFFTLLLTSLGWAYVNLAIFFAHLARKNRLTPQETDTGRVYAGAYIELAPSAICTAFLAVGVASTLYLKVKFGPSPFIFATILTCICLDITLVYAPLFPYPVYTLGEAIVLPLAVKSAVVIIVSCVFFPKSVNSAFVERLLIALKPLSDGCNELEKEIQKSPLDVSFNFQLMREKVLASEACLMPLLGQERLVAREVSFALASGDDLKGLVSSFRRLLAPADGVAFYFNLIKADLVGLDFQLQQPPSTKEFLASRISTPGTSRPVSRPGTRPVTPTLSPSSTPIPSRPGTPPLPSASSDSVMQQQSAPESVQSGGAQPRKRLGSKNAAQVTKAASSSVHSTPLHRHSFELRKRLHEFTHLHPHRHQQAHSPLAHPHHDHRHGRSHEVGMWESLRYTAFETQFHGRGNDHITEACVRMLADVSEELLKSQRMAYTDLREWLLALNKERTRRLRDLLCLRSTKMTEPLLRSADGRPKTIKDTIVMLEKALTSFKERKQAVIEPFRASVEPDSMDAECERWPHRYLFQCLTYCYFQSLYTSRLVDFLRAIEDIESRRKVWRIWWPKISFHVEAWRSHDGEAEAEHDEDPDEIPGMATSTSLGQTRARDPDALGSDGKLQAFGVAVSRFIHQLSRGNSLFMIKVGMTTVLVALPSLLQRTAGWAYENKAIWVVIMSQFVSARHRGEVLFGLWSRIIATFMGAVGGLVIWYIASGNGVANHFALAAVTAVAFPIVMAGRIFYPGPPITPIITCVTVALIVGYSWKDARNPTPGSPGIGWDVAWRRFIEVTIGASASYIVAILPPSSSMRTYYRASHATIIRETGGLFCKTVYFAATTRDHQTQGELRTLLEELLAVRSKIRRLATLKGSISYEWSLRGRWPIKRYESLERIELRVLRLLTHAVTIYETLGPSYSHALLKRTQFLDPSFLADCIAVLSMCTTSLATRQPLPQIAPVLIDRYMSKPWGFKVRKDQQATHVDLDTDTGLPSTVTFETLADEQYQTFAVGACVSFGIVINLDQLCVAVKALVGETYAVPADVHGYQPFSMH